MDILASANPDSISQWPGGCGVFMVDIGAISVKNIELLFHWLFINLETRFLSLYIKS